MILRCRTTMRRRTRLSDAGFTLVEVAMVTGLLGTVLAIALGALASFQNTIVKSDSRSQSNDQARLAAEQIDRQVRSGNVLYDPTLEGSKAGTNPDGSPIPTGFAMRIYTQSNGIERCVQWRLLNTYDLQKRSWSQTWKDDNQISGWRTVAQSIVNPTSSPPFSLDPNTGFGGANSRLVNVDLIANVDPTRGANVEIKSSAEGRNTGYFPTNSGLCTDIPPP